MNVVQFMYAIGTQVWLKAIERPGTVTACLVDTWNTDFGGSLKAYVVADELLLPIRPERDEELERVQSMAFAIRNSRLSSHEHAGPTYFSTTREP